MNPPDPGLCRFLFSTTTGYGHFHPLVPLAQALRAAGHTVAFAARPALQRTVEALGFPFFPVGGNLAADPEYQAVKAQMAQMPPSLAAELFSYPHVFAGIPARLRTGDLVTIAQSWRPDMVIREAAEYASLVAAEYLGLPHATVAFAAALKGMALFEREVAAQLDPVRRQWGRTPDPALAAPYRYLHLCYAPPSFALQDVDATAGTPPVPPTTHFLRPAVFDQAAPDSLPAWVADLPPQPTIYLTLGTEVNKEAQFYPSVLQTLIAGLRELPVNLIVTLGRDRDPADFGPQPANVHIERYIPQSLLLPHCDLLVMHAGSNSVLGALDAGLPVVAVPLIADQFVNADVVARLGLGQVVPLADLTPDRARAAAAAVLADASYRQTAARLRAELHALPGSDAAVALVEQVAYSREAIRRET